MYARPITRGIYTPIIYIYIYVYIFVCRPATTPSPRQTYTTAGNARRRRQRIPRGALEARLQLHHPGIELGRLRLLLVDRDFTGEGELFHAVLTLFCVHGAFSPGACLLLCARMLYCMRSEWVELGWVGFWLGSVLLGWVRLD